MGIPTTIEDFISRPMDMVHTGKRFQPVDLNRMALKCLERGSRKGINRIYAPNQFRIILSCNDYKDLSPFLNRLMQDIKSELCKVVEERNYLLAGELKISIERSENKSVAPVVTGIMQSSNDSESLISKPQNRESTELSEIKKYSDLKTVIMLPGYEGRDNYQRSPEKQTRLDEIILLPESDESVSSVSLKTEHSEKKEKDNAMCVADKNRCVVDTLSSVSGFFSTIKRFLAYNKNKLVLFFLPENIRRNIIQETNSDFKKGFLEKSKFEISIPGAEIYFEKEGIFLLNKKLDHNIRVNGKIEPVLSVKKGDLIELGGISLRYES